MSKAQAQRQRFHIVDDPPPSPVSGGGGGATPIGPGQSSIGAHLREVRQQLNRVIADLKSKQVSPGIGAVQVQALNAILRALSEERKVVTEEAVEARVAELEEKIRG